MKRKIAIFLLVSMLAALGAAGCSRTPPEPTVPGSTAQPSGTTEPSAAPDPTTVSDPTVVPEPTTVPDPTTVTNPTTIPQPTEPASPTEPVERKPDGLIEVNGKLMKGGKEFYGMGVNYFDMFTGCMGGNWDYSKVMTALENLKAYDCKVIRFSTLPFYARSMGLYFDQEETYWSKLDALVEKCEELEIGLIPSMFWTFAFFDYYGEVYEEAIFDENSQGMTFMRTYTEKFVQRYAQSPAIYGWEFSNEKILAADIPGQELYDTYLSTDGLNHIYTVWADIVAENDPYGRIISTGDTNPRESQYNQWKLHSWNKDSWEQHLEVLGAINPGKIDTISQHQYSLGSVLDAGDRTMPLFDATTWDAFFRYLKEVSATLGKACYVGEAGFGLDKALGWENVSLEQMQKVYDAIGEAAYNNKMQLVLLWNYDESSSLPEGYIYGRGSGTEYSWNENMVWGRMALETMQAVNGKFAEDNP